MQAPAKGKAKSQVKKSRAIVKKKQLGVIQEATVPDPLCTGRCIARERERGS